MINAAGSAIAVTMEGTRPILVEVQGLTSPTQFGNARRTANGIDFNRLLLISAVLTRRAGFKLSEQDIFVNVVGGLQIDEPAADLAVAAAIASSWKDVSVKADAVLIGEIGLAGELRMPGQMQARLKEASKLGFKTAIVPKAIFLRHDFFGETAPVNHRNHAIAGFEAARLRTCVDDNAGDFRARHERQRRLALIFTLHDEAHRETDADGLHLDQHFARAGRG
jgi:predicted ATP-dependent serine protease